MTLTRLGGYLLLCLGISLGAAFLIRLMQDRWSMGKTLAWCRRYPALLLAGGMLICALTAGVAAASTSFPLGLVAGCLTALLLGYVNLLMLLYRDQPLVPRDMVMVLSIHQLAAMVSPLFVGILAAALGGAAGLVVLLRLAFPPLLWPDHLRIRLLAGSLVVAALFLSLGLRRNPLRRLLQKLGADFDSFQINAHGSYGRNGFLLAFCSQIGMPMVRRPKGYGSQAVEAVARRYRGQESGLFREEERPDIVFVMSEAFSDPTALSGLTFSEDPIPRIRARMKNTLHGRALVPGCGGGTAHCEFEALTGFSIALCGGASPYEGVVAKRERFPSLARTLGEAGYRTTALHPYTDVMYARPKAYASMGFDEFLVHTDMKHREKLGHSPYISDRSAYEEALELLEEEERPRFIHLVTMQNHGEYPPGRYRNTIRAQGLREERIHRFLETYVQGLRHTDEATDWFLERLEQRKRPTLVVFWGDHLPGGYSGENLAAWGNRKFETPFFLWSSRGLPAEDCGRRNPLFFRTLLSRAAGMPATPFDQLLQELERELHVIHMAFFVDGGERELARPAGRAQELLKDYQMIQYDAVEGQGYADREGFYSIPGLEEERAQSPIDQ